ncbi:hypothetical protein RJ639_036048, partial [Escallonia herrerae]
FLPTCRADDEPVDPKKYLEESCKPKCVKSYLDYQACAKRVETDETGHKHCTGQYFDYWHCVDKCVSLLTYFIILAFFYSFRYYDRISCTLLYTVSSADMQVAPKLFTKLK